MSVLTEHYSDPLGLNFWTIAWLFSVRRPTKFEVLEKAFFPPESLSFLAAAAC